MGRVERIFRKARLRTTTAWKVLNGFDSAYSRSTIKVSFSQCGEDLIIQFLMDYLGIPQPRYVDIGAHDPEHMSNSALLYLRGCRGINIEPDPRLFAAFLKQRPRDINLQVGVGGMAGTLSLFRMADPALSTFSEAEAHRISEDLGIAIVDSVEVPIVTLQKVLLDHDFRPDFLAIDAEGKDFEILDSYDFGYHRPAVVCVETVTFSLTGDGRKIPEISRVMQNNGYRAYADTYINTIYVDDARFRSRNP